MSTSKRQIDGDEEICVLHVSISIGLRTKVRASLEGSAGAKSVGWQ
jgi:hypothetical protein